MDERRALALLSGELEPVGDDAAVVDDLVVTTDMLHETTDFPPGTTRYTAGWRSVAASLSDVAAMGAEATAAVAVYAAPTFDREQLLAFVRGASDVCEAVEASYVGGDLDEHTELTVATTAIGKTTDPVYRDGAEPGNAVCVTGTLGRSGAALTLFERDRIQEANELFQFEPRIQTGLDIAPYATALMDSSDGLARSLHQLAEASECGFAIESDQLPIDDSLRRVTSEADVLERATTFGEDFELVFTVPEADLDAVTAEPSVPISRIGRVTESEAGLTMDGEQLADRGYTH